MNVESDPIRDAAVWWRKSGVRGAPWRTEDLRPIEPLVRMADPRIESPYRDQTGEEERRARLVEGVVRRRAGKLLVDPTEPQPRGCLLLSWGCNFSLGSGEAEALTDGFFDEYDLPPWDLWVTYRVPAEVYPYGGPALVAWIPEQLIAIADRGAKACPGDCVSWSRNP